MLVVISISVAREIKRTHIVNETVRVPCGSQQIAVKWNGHKQP